MTAAHLQNFHHPVAHNARVKRLIRKFTVELSRTKCGYEELLSEEESGPRMACEDRTRAVSVLYLKIADIGRTIEELESLIIPEEG